MCKKIIIVLILFLFSSAAFGGEFEKIDFVDANLIDVVKALSMRAGLDLVISADMGKLANKKVTLHLRKASYIEAIDYILQTNGLALEREGNVILVSTLPGDLRSSAYNSSLQVLDLKYISGEQASKLLAKVMPKVTFAPGERANSLILKGKSSEVSEAKRIISELDKPLPQILIEGKIVEVSSAGIEEMGITWGGKQGSFKFSVDKITGKFAPIEDLLVTLDTLVSQGKANVIANPRIATLDSHEARINIGSRVPYAVPTSTSSNSTEWAVRYLDAGVSLKIIPRLGEEGLIVTSICPEVSSISEWRTTAAGEFPVITTRNAEATVRVKDGETIVVGGLINEADRENISKLPILGDIPILGYLFQSRVKERSKTEIIFLITPHVIT